MYYNSVGEKKITDTILLHKKISLIQCNCHKKLLKVSEFMTINNLNLLNIEDKKTLLIKIIFKTKTLKNLKYRISSK